MFQFFVHTQFVPVLTCRRLFALLSRWSTHLLTLETITMNLRRIASLSLLFLLTPKTLLADVSLNNLFGDHMVLQQGI